MGVDNCPLLCYSKCMEKKTTTLNYNTPTFAGRTTNRWAVTETLDIRETFLRGCEKPFTVDETVWVTEFQMECTPLGAFATFEEAVAFATA